MKTVLAIVTTIVLIIIYIPIIYFIVKRRRKKFTWYAIFPLAVILLPILFLVVWFNVPYYYLPPFEGKVIDAETEQPISGAAVLAVYYGEYPSIAGASTYAIDAQETLTDEKGEFKIPEVKDWFGEHPGTPVEANLIIFKPGYGAFPRHKDARMAGIGKGWPPPSKYVVYELPKLKTRKEREQNVILMRKHAYPLYLKAINEERKSLGLRIISQPKDAK
jgi:hypothetical protein